MIIDLRSDTVTKPTKPMLEAMFSAEVGDDVFEEDPTVKKLEQKLAEMFKMESGLFCPSGTMCNQIAIRIHTQPGDEIICDESAHIYNFEGGGPATNSGASIKVIKGANGIISPEDIKSNTRSVADWYARSRMVFIENTCNITGGNYYTLEQIKALSAICKENELKFHLDGARIFNALAETRDSPQDFGQYFDSISIVLSKALGCPVGSVILGNKDFIKKARKTRKILGGGMRQVGYLAAAGLYALDHHIDRLKDDHQRARALQDILAEISFVEEILPVYTNIVVFKLNNTMNSEEFENKLSKENIKVVHLDSRTIRMVTHLDFDDEMLERVSKVLRSL